MENKTNYYDVDAISNSALSKINPSQGGSIRKYQLWKEEKKEEKELTYFERGRLLHTAILEPERYSVADIERPSDNVVTIVKAVYDAFGVNSILPDSMDTGARNMYIPVVDIIVTKAKELGFGQHWKTETLYEKVRKEGSAYLKYLIESTGKLVISAEDKKVIDECYFALQKHPEAQRKLFQEEQETEKEIYGEMFGVKVKSKLDILNEQHEIITVRELKTTSKPISLFPQSFQWFRYYRQSAFYGAMAVLEKLKENPDKIVLPPRHEYIVVETRPPYEVMVYTIHPDWIFRGQAEIKAILEYWKKGEHFFPTTEIQITKDRLPYGTSKLMNF